MIWFALLIPAVIVVLLWSDLIYGTRKKIVGWEYALLFGTPGLAIVISYLIAVSSQQVDTEYWNGFITSATYTQSWQEWDHETCYRDCNCHQVCTGSGEDRRCRQECSRCPYDCSHCDNHPEVYRASDNLGNTWSITPATFETWAGLWGNRVFIDMNRHINYHTDFFGNTCGRDGDAFKTTYNGGTENILPVVLQKHYSNKIQTTFKPVDTSKVREFELFDYPVYDRFNYNPVLGLNDPRVSRRLANWNARLGNAKQVHMLLLVYHNQPIEAAKWQEEYWKGGNKNEFILAMSVGRPADDTVDFIQWAKIISWTDQRGLRAQLESVVSGMHFEKDIDYVAIVDTMAVRVKAQFIRKNWHAFDKIKVRPSKTAEAITWILTLIITAGVGCFIVFNDVKRT